MKIYLIIHIDQWEHQITPTSKQLEERNETENTIDSTLNKCIAF